MLFVRFTLLHSLPWDYMMPSSRVSKAYLPASSMLSLTKLKCQSDSSGPKCLQVLRISLHSLCFHHLPRVPTGSSPWPKKNDGCKDLRRELNPTPSLETNQVGALGNHRLEDETKRYGFSNSHWTWGCFLSSHYCNISWLTQWTITFLSSIPRFFSLNIWSCLWIWLDLTCFPKRYKFSQKHVILLTLIQGSWYTI